MPLLIYPIKAGDRNNNSRNNNSKNNKNAGTVYFPTMYSGEIDSRSSINKTEIY